MPFTLAPSLMKYLGIYPTKYVQDLYEIKYNTVVNEKKKSSINGEILHVRG